MSEVLSEGANEVLAFHQVLPGNEPRYAVILVGKYQSIRTIQDLDHAYYELEQAGHLQSSDCVELVDPNRPMVRSFRSKFRCRK